MFPHKSFECFMYANDDDNARVVVEKWVDLLQSQVDEFKKALEDPEWVKDKTFGEIYVSE